MSTANNGQPQFLSTPFTLDGQGVAARGQTGPRNLNGEFSRAAALLSGQPPEERRLEMDATYARIVQKQKTVREGDSCRDLVDYVSATTLNLKLPHSYSVTYLAFF